MEINKIVEVIDSLKSQIDALDIDEREKEIVAFCLLRRYVQKGYYVRLIDEKGTVMDITKYQMDTSYADKTSRG
jgi:hypothetical protein